MPNNASPTWFFLRNGVKRRMVARSTYSEVEETTEYLCDPAPGER
jgi:hypothetical protein